MTLSYPIPDFQDNIIYNNEKLTTLTKLGLNGYANELSSPFRIGNGLIYYVNSGFFMEKQKVSMPIPMTNSKDLLSTKTYWGFVAEDSSTPFSEIPSLGCPKTSIAIRAIYPGGFYEVNEEGQFKEYIKIFVTTFFFYDKDKKLITSTNYTINPNTANNPAGSPLITPTKAKIKLELGKIIPENAYFYRVVYNGENDINTLKYNVNGYYEFYNSDQNASVIYSYDQNLTYSSYCKDGALRKSQPIHIQQYEILTKGMSELNDSSSIKTSLVSVRVNNKNYITNSIGVKKKFLTTLSDFIKDIWTDSAYGLGESLDLLDIRCNLEDKNCNLIIDKEYRIIDLISDVLKSYNMYIIPDGAKFVINEYKKQDISQFTFHNGNCKKISYTLSIPDMKQNGSQMIVSFFKQAQMEESYVRYPENVDSQNYQYETTNSVYLPGISTSNEALKVAKYLFKKQNQTGRQCEIVTSTEGFVPELQSKVEVIHSYDQNIMIYDIQKFIDNKIYIPDNINSSKKHAYLIDEFGNKSDTFDIIYDKNIIYIPENIDGSIYKFFCCFDTVEEKVEYIVEGILPSESFVDGSSLEEVKLILKEYDETIYE